MAVPTTEEFLARYPEFGEQTTSVVEGALAEAAAQIPETVWGSLQTQAIGYLAAHLLAVRIMQIGQQVGTISGSALDKGLAASLYGQSYMDLGATLPLTGFTF